MNGLVRAMRDGDHEGMQDFDGNIEKLTRAGVVDLETGLAFATNPGNLRLQLADVVEEQNAAAEKTEVKTAQSAPAQSAAAPKPAIAPQKTPQKTSEREPEMVIE